MFLDGVVSTETGYVVVLSAGGIHVLAADTGAVLAQWWCEPAREPDLAALVGLDVQVQFVFHLGEGRGVCDASARCTKMGVVVFVFIVVVLCCFGCGKTVFVVVGVLLFCEGGR